MEKLSELPGFHMIYVILAFIIATAGVILLFLRGRAAYYGKIFSDDHYVEVGNWLHSMLKLGPVSELDLGNNTAFQSSAGCGFTFTREVGERDTIHIAISQVGNPTTHAVCNRLAFLILQILKENKAEADFYYTESSVHHLLFSKDVGGEWLTNEIDTVLVAMQSNHTIPFRFEPMREA
jgi:hypothetical protein